jgi:hypothetical protein
MYIIKRHSNRVTDIAPCHSGIAVVLPWYCRVVTVVLTCCDSGVTVVLQWCYSEPSSVHVALVIVVLPCHCRVVTVFLQRCYKT